MEGKKKKRRQMRHFILQRPQVKYILFAKRLTLKAALVNAALDQEEAVVTLFNGKGRKVEFEKSPTLFFSQNSKAYPVLVPAASKEQKQGVILEVKGRKSKLLYIETGPPEARLPRSFPDIKTLPIGHTIMEQAKKEEEIVD